MTTNIFLKLLIIRNTQVSIPKKSVIACTLIFEPISVLVVMEKKFGNTESAVSQ